MAEKVWLNQIDRNVEDKQQHIKQRKTEQKLDIIALSSPKYNE